MGIFSSKTVYTVSSVAYNIAGDAADRRNFLKEQLVFLNASGQSIGEKLPRIYLNSLGVKLKRAYKHVAMLPQGLPTASIQLWQGNEFDEAVQDLLDGVNPGRYKVQDTYLTSGNTAPAIENYLNQKYGWDSVTGLMSTPPTGFASNAQVIWYEIYNERGTRTTGYTIEFRHLPTNVEPDLTVHVTLDTVIHAAESILVALISEWITNTRSDTTITRAFTAGDVTGEVVTPVTTTVGARTTTTTTTVTTTTDGVNTTIRTRIVDAYTSEAVSRSYQLGTGEWPTLDSLWLNTAHVEKTYFPSIPFRVDNKDVWADNLSETAEYKARKKVVQLMGMDAMQIRDMINTNKDVKEIDFAFLQAGANMNTESQAEMDYLFRFWDLCYSRQTASEADLAAWEAGSKTNKPKQNTLTIKDPQSGSGAYNVTIEWSYIKKTTVDGTISPTAKVGSLDIVNGGSVTNVNLGGLFSHLVLDKSYVNIRKQISSTQYIDLKIVGAIHKNEVYKGKKVETKASEARTDPEENEGFIIPLHMGILDSMSMVKRTQLAQECIYMVFNTYVKTKKKWYQRGIFKVILAIIAVVIIIVTWGAGTPVAAGAFALATAIGIPLLFAHIIMTFVIGYLVSMLVGRLYPILAAIVGEKLAAIITAVAAVAVSFASGGFAGLNILQSAVQIINIASQVFGMYVQGEMVKLQGKWDDFMEGVNKDQKALDKLNEDFFGASNLVSVDYLLELQKTLRADTPSVFLGRTLMVGSDVVDYTLAQISDFTALTVSPRLQGIV